MSAKKYVFRILWLLAPLLVAACMPQPEVSVEILPRWEALFQKEDGWTGADGAYSLALSDDQILWLFGDTWIGPIVGGRHENATIVNNSIGIQRHKNPAEALVEFYYGKTPDGKPAAFIQPADGRGWFWIYHGIRTSEGLFLFLVQIIRTGGESDLGFDVIGNWLAHVSNPHDPPAQWHIEQHKIPWSRFSVSGDTLFGSALLEDDGYIYIYGITEEIISGFPQKHMILARVPESRLGDFDRWRFFDGSRWVPDFSNASRLIGQIANEYTVSFQSGLDKFVVVYSENGFSENIVLRLAPEPYGPWDEPVIFYQCPEANWYEGIICYAAKGHPDISMTSDELIVTYIANSMDFYQMAADARLYRPRFLRVSFGVQTEN